MWRAGKGNVFQPFREKMGKMLLISSVIFLSYRFLHLKEYWDEVLNSEWLSDSFHLQGKLLARVLFCYYLYSKLRGHTLIGAQMRSRIQRREHQEQGARSQLFLDSLLWTFWILTFFSSTAGVGMGWAPRTFLDTFCPRPSGTCHHSTPTHPTAFHGHQTPSGPQQATFFGFLFIYLIVFLKRERLCVSMPGETAVREGERES